MILPLPNKKGINVVSMAVENIEKKPFKHYFPKSRTLSIGFKGVCPLRCKFCENHEISHFKNAKFEKIGILDIFSTASSYKCESICATYNEPLSAYDDVMEVAKACRKLGYRFLLKTNAYIKKELWENILEYVDAVNIDWKGDEKSFKEITGVSHYFLPERVQEALLFSHVELSIPIYYQTMEEMERNINFLSFCLKDNRSVPCHLLKINPAYKHMQITSEEMIETAYKILINNGHDNIYIF